MILMKNKLWKDFIDGLRREGYSIPLDDLKDLIEYYEELLDEQEIGKDDYVPDEYDYKKIIRNLNYQVHTKKLRLKRKLQLKISKPYYIKHSVYAHIISFISFYLSRLITDTYRTIRF